MTKLRHVAMQVPDLEYTATFYQTVFDFRRVAEAKTPIGDSIMLSDGAINLALLYLFEGEVGGINSPDWAGLHHFGFLVDDKDDTIEWIEEMGGDF